MEAGRRVPRRGSGRRSTAQRRRATGAQRRARASAVRRQSIDVDKLVESIVDEAVAQLGLDILGLPREQYVEMLKPIVEGIVSMYSSRPSGEAILSRLRNTAEQVYMLASAYLLEKLEKLSPEQLEFVVSYGGPVAAKHAPRLYRMLVEAGREDLVPRLRYLWEQYGNPTPLECPRCGFRALTPDLVCMVCGYEASEREVKKAIDFEEKLRWFAETASVEEVREAIERGYVLVGEYIKGPSGERSPLDAEIRLSMEERELLRRLIAERRLGHGGSG